MSEFYRFPAIKGLEDFDNSDQLEKIDSEVEESRDAYFYASNYVAFGIELMDVIHAAETALRMNFTDEEVENMQQLTVSKNKKRGYYND